MAHHVTAAPVPPSLAAITTGQIEFDRRLPAQIDPRDPHESFWRAVARARLRFDPLDQGAIERLRLRPKAG